MADILAFISQFSLVFAAMLLTRLLRPRHPVQFLLTYAVVLATSIVLLGFLLSAVSRFGQILWWAGGSVVILLLIAVPVALHPGARALCWRRISLLKDIEQRVAAAMSWRFDIVVLIALGSVAALVLAINLLIVIGLEPGNVDALTYHLPRTLYYLQHDSLRFYDANYWADVLHPKISTILFAYTYLVGGKMIGMTQLVQWLACLVSMLAIYGITRLVGGSRRGSLLAALLFTLVPICLTEAATAQNDLVLTAFVACTFYFVLAFRESRRLAHLLLACLAFALGAGVKATMVTVALPLLPVAVYCLLPRSGEDRPRTPRWIAIGAGGLLAALLLITLPSGYAENMRVFHHPFGNRTIRTHHSYEGVSPLRLLRYGGLNLLRLASNFQALDGLGPLPGVPRAQKRIDAFIKQATHRMGVDLASAAGVRKPFGYSYEHVTLADENHSYWGVLGLLLIWPAAFLVALGRKYPPGARLLALGLFLYCIAQAFAGPYDDFHGRYFTTGLLFALPAVGFISFASRTRLARGYVIFVLLLGGLAALCSVMYRKDTYVLPFKTEGRVVRSTFTLGQTAQLVRQFQPLFLFVLDYETHVPVTAVVANDIRGYVAFPEFLLYGEPVTRRIIPIRPWFGPPKPPPPEADYLVFSNQSRKELPGDILLGNPEPLLGALYLRKLKASVTKDPAAEFYGK
ncbi:MAG: glycosyltransferase family 39 protein [Armatimonadota bacterium]